MPFILYDKPTLCNSHDDINNHFNQAISAGYEGIVVKHPNAFYEHNVRSNKMWKYKLALSAEFEIVNYELDRRGHPVFHLQTPEGKIFKAKPKGTNDERLIMAANANSYLFKWATIEFECYSDSAIPLKPVFITVRNCTSKGEPLE